MKWQEELRKNLEKKPSIKTEKLKRSVSWFKKNLSLLPKFETLTVKEKKVIKEDTEEIIKKIETQIKSEEEK